jgi:periplasmic divalent cation tolerance protein
MKDPGEIVVFITTKDEQEAETIAQLLLDRHLIACCNMVSDVRSMFRWQGALESEDECLMILKTRSSLLNEVVEAVKSAHSYEVPEIIAIPVIGGNQEYLKWIGDVTG